MPLLVKYTTDAIRWKVDREEVLSHSLTQELHWVLCHCPDEESWGQWQQASIKVKLPKKNALRVKLADEGCAVLCSWICLFTRNHAANLSWDGAFDLDSFIVLHGQVHALKPPKPRLASHSERLKDFEELAKLIKNIFIMDRQHPPYLSHLLTKLTKLPRGPLLESYRVALETHFCLLTPIGGSNTLY